MSSNSKDSAQPTRNTSARCDPAPSDLDPDHELDLGLCGQAVAPPRPPRLNKAGDRRGLHGNHSVPHLPRRVPVSEEEEDRFHDQAFDTSLRTKRFKFNLQGYNVRNFINAVIKSPLVQDLLSKEFLHAAEETNTQQNKYTPPSVATGSQHMSTSKDNQVSTEKRPKDTPNEASMEELSERFCGKEKVMKLLTEQRITRNRKRHWPKECIQSIDPLLAFLSEPKETTEPSYTGTTSGLGLGEAPDEDMADIPDSLPSPELGLNYGQRDAVDLGLGDGEIESNADDVGETTIAYRTRNKLNLEDEPIEQFELPVDYDETENIISPKKKKSDEPTNIAHVTRHDDVTNDHVTADSVDDDVRSHVTVDDDVTWKQWVNGLMNQGEVAPRNWDEDSYDSDPDFDYNFCADKTGADDDERMEKGSSQFEIEIPQDEKEMLVREALNYLGIKNPVDLPMICKTLVLPKILNYDAEKREKKRKRYDDSLNFNLESLHSKLKQQLQMHTQLLTQHYLSMMTSKMWEKQRKTCQTWMSDLLSLQSQTSSFLCISNLAEASKIVNFPFSYEIGSSDTLPNSLLRIFIYSEVFMYRELLPYLFFNPHRATTDSDLFSHQKMWTDPEDCIIALGLSDIGNITTKRGRSIFTLQKVCLYVHQHILPIREPSKILRRCYYLLNKKTPNPVKYFGTYKKLPELPQDVAFLQDSEIRAPVDLASVDPGWPLPMWMQVLVYLDNDQGSQFVLQCQTQVATFSHRLRQKLEANGIDCENCGSIYGSETDTFPDDPLDVSREILCQDIGQETNCDNIREDNSQTEHPNMNEFIEENEANVSIQIELNNSGRNEQENIPEEANNSGEFASKSPELPIIGSDNNNSAVSRVPRPFSFTKSPAKIASDRLVKRAIRTSLASPDKVVKRASKSPFKSLSMECETVRHNSKGLKIERQSLLPSKTNLAKDHSRVTERSSSAVRRLIRKRKNWHQSRKSYTSAMAYFRQSLYPQKTPEVDSRIHSLREEIFSKIYDQFGFEKYSLFLNLLEQIGSEAEISRIQFLADEIKVLFTASKMLFLDLAKLVPKTVAIALGLFFQYESFIRAQSFLQKVEASCKDNTRQFNIILDTFASSARDETTIWNNVTPLLEFNPYLIDEFTLLFPNEPVPESFRGPFEEIILTEDDERINESLGKPNLGEPSATELENQPTSGLENQLQDHTSCSHTMGSNPADASPVFEEIVLLDDEVETHVREKALDGNMADKKQSKSGTLNLELHNNQCILRNIMQAKYDQVVKRRIDGPVSPKKAKRPATPHATASDAKTS